MRCNWKCASTCTWKKQPPFAYDERKAGAIGPWLERILTEALATCGRLYGR